MPIISATAFADSITHASAIGHTLHGMMWLIMILSSGITATMIHTGT